MTGRMTPDDLDRWQALADKATCGPWQVLLDGRSWAGTVVVADAAGHPVTVVSSAPDDDDAKDDAEFIAATRDAVPALIAEVQRLREQEARGEDSVGDRPIRSAPGSHCEQWADDITALIEEVERLRLMEQRGRALQEETLGLPLIHRHNIDLILDGGDDA